MELKKQIIEPLIERMESYANTSIELYQYKLIDKGSEVGTHVITKFFNILLILLFLVPLNVALALFLGDLFGKLYLGFLTVAGFYFFLWLLFQVFKKIFKRNLNNRIIAKLIKTSWAQ